MNITTLEIARDAISLEIQGQNITEKDDDWTKGVKVGLEVALAIVDRKIKYAENEM